MSVHTPEAVKRYWVDALELTDTETHTEPYCGPNAEASIVVFAADFDAIKMQQADLAAALTLAERMVDATVRNNPMPDDIDALMKIRAALAKVQP